MTLSSYWHCDHSTSACCVKLKWLERRPNPSWSQDIQAHTCKELDICSHQMWNAHAESDSNRLTSKFATQHSLTSSQQPASLRVHIAEHPLGLHPKTELKFDQKVCAKNVCYSDTHTSHHYYWGWVNKKRHLIMKVRRLKNLIHCQIHYSAKPRIELHKASQHILSQQWSPCTYHRA